MTRGLGGAFAPVAKLFRRAYRVLLPRCRLSCSMLAAVSPERRLAVRYGKRVGSVATGGNFTGAGINRIRTFTNLRHGVNQRAAAYVQPFPPVRQFHYVLRR